MLGLLAFVVTYLCVPLARRLALRLDAVDYPSARRVNKKPTPRMGGVAMAAGIAAALIVEVAGEYFFGWAGFYIHGTDRAINHAGVMCGLLTIVCVGAMDDVYSLKPSVKFAGQILGRPSSRPRGFCCRASRTRSAPGSSSSAGGPIRSRCCTSCAS